MRILHLLTKLTLLFLVLPAYGHHSPAAFNLGSTIDVQGVVTRFDWKNPHVYIYIDATGASNLPIIWQVEADPTALMSRSGWNSSTLQPGDIVSVQLNPDRNAQRKHGLLVSLTKADGSTFKLRAGEPSAKRSAKDISGIWDALSNFSPPYINSTIGNPNHEFTQVGLAAQAAYTNADFPPSECLPFQTPFLTMLPYLNEIEIHPDTVLIKNEFYNVDRTIYIDGRSRPENALRSSQGYSIGRWEGETLIVDTTLFSDFRLSYGSGVPSGAKKHTIEKFHLSEDRTQLLIDIFVEDPEYLAEPISVSISWDYAPDRKLERFGCDPENAKEFQIQ